MRQLIYGTAQWAAATSSLFIAVRSVAMSFIISTASGGDDVTASNLFRLMCKTSGRSIMIRPTDLTSCVVRSVVDGDCCRVASPCPPLPLQHTTIK